MELLSLPRAELLSDLVCLGWIRGLISVSPSMLVCDELRQSRIIETQ